MLSRISEQVVFSGENLRIDNKGKAVKGEPKELTIELIKKDGIYKVIARWIDGDAR